MCASSTRRPAGPTPSAGRSASPGRRRRGRPSPVCPSVPMDDGGRATGTPRRTTSSPSRTTRSRPSTHGLGWDLLSLTPLSGGSDGVSGSGSRDGGPRVSESEGPTSRGRWVGELSPCCSTPALWGVGGRDDRRSPDLGPRLHVPGTGRTVHAGWPAGVSGHYWGHHSIWTYYEAVFLRRWYGSLRFSGGCSYCPAVGFAKCVCDVSPGPLPSSTLPGPDVGRDGGGRLTRVSDLGRRGRVWWGGGRPVVPVGHPSEGLASGTTVHSRRTTRGTQGRRVLVGGKVLAESPRTGDSARYLCRLGKPVPGPT